MDSLRKIEEDLRNFGVESKKKYPEVIDASERALATLKTIREMYVADKMRRSAVEREDVKIPQSSDITAPYILACNYVDASPKLILSALNGIHLIIHCNVAPAEDVQDILRVFNIQAASEKPELQLKILQVLLQLANSLSKNEEASIQLTESVLKNFLSLTFAMCSDKTSMSVSSTALATTRQIVAIIMEGIEHCPETRLAEAYAKSSQKLVRDLTLLIRGLPCEWLKNVNVTQIAAFDLLDFILVGWKELYLSNPAFSKILKEEIMQSLKPLLQGMQDAYALTVVKKGTILANNTASRTARLARYMLVTFVNSPFLDEIDIIITLMVHSLTSDHDALQGENWKDVLSARERDSLDGSTSVIGGATALIGGLTKFQNPFASAPKEKNNGSIGVDALQKCYIPISKSNSSGHLGGDISAGQDGNITRLLSHPVALCLEALVSFFLSDIFEIGKMEDGNQLIISTMINTSISVAGLLTKALAIGDNVQDLEKCSVNNQLINTLEGVLLSSENDATAVLQHINDLVFGSNEGMSNGETMILALYLLQFICRRLVEMTAPVLLESTEGKHQVFVSGDVRLSKQVIAANDTAELKQVGEKVCMGVYESVQEACMAVLMKVSVAPLLRRSLGILSEMAVVGGALGLTFPCEVLLSSLCRFTVPRWHGYDRPGEGQTQVAPQVLQWKHIQATVRLCQTVHLLCDVISDWDGIIDAFEQIVACILSPRTVMAEEVTSSEIDKLFAAMERFKEYTVYFSDASLVKVMTSLVAMSLNNLAVVARSSTKSTMNLFGDKGDRGEIVRPKQYKDDEISSFAKKNNRPLKAPEYMIAGISSGIVSYSLQSVVEITKYNIYRVACIWQMTTSHLRMVASLKSDMVRAIAVNSLLDMINSTMLFLQRPARPTIETVNAGTKLGAPHIDTSLPLSDEVLFNTILTTFDLSFIGRPSHMTILDSLMSREDESLQLSQSDVFSCLNMLSSVRFDDVKTNVVSGLLTFLQNGGEMLNTSGWSCVIEMITQISDSFTASSEGDSSESLQSMDTEDQLWPLASMTCAFNCMKLLVDEYMEMIPAELVTSVITCLSSFSAQTEDVNISLTSLEMLWKVYDQRMRVKRAQGDSMKGLFNATMTQLLTLSLDMRPEIRHCAMNTLFAALTMSTNASLTTDEQWKQIFYEIIFPLFEKAGERSTIAKQSNEEANAPELKKGTKMILHHSRDTAHKQWSETRVLALRGLTRVIRTCALALIKEKWFRVTWANVLKICKEGSQSPEQEVATGSLDVMFVMLKIVSTNGFDMLVKKGQVNANLGGSAREDLWKSTWEAVSDSAKFSCSNPDVALHICENLSVIYKDCSGNEFTQKDNMNSLCESLVMLSRPRIESSAIGTDEAFRPTDLQLHRLLVELIGDLELDNISTVTVLTSALTRICFAGQHSQILNPITDEVVILGSCSQHFREELKKYILDTFLEKVINTFPDHETKSILLDTVYGEFINNVCGPAIAARSNGVNFDSPRKEKRKVDQGGERGAGSKRLSGFFSFLAGSLGESDVDSDSDDGDDGCSTSRDEGTDSKDDTWTIFYPADVDIQILISILRIVARSDSREDIVDYTIENIFSSLKCLMSPWKLSELPGAIKAYGTFVDSSARLVDQYIEMIDLLQSLTSRDDGCGWYFSLLSTLTHAVQLQIHVVSTEKEVVDSAPLLRLWSKVAEILSTVMNESKVRVLRSCATTALLSICRDISNIAMESSNSIIITG